MSRKSKLLRFPLNVDRKQDQAVEEFSGAMLSQLRLQKEFFIWEPTEEEMLLGLAKLWEQIRQAHHIRDRRAVQVASADLGNLALKCFNYYGK